jgi:hypothetical protein
MGPIRLCWEDASGAQRYAHAKCIDISEKGLRIELHAAIPLHANVSLNAERINLFGPARVRHVARHGAKYIAGLELSQELHEKALAAIRSPWALRTPVAAV